MAENLQCFLLSLSITDSFLNILVICSNSTSKNTDSWFADATEKKQRMLHIYYIPVKKSLKEFPENLIYSLGGTHRMLPFFTTLPFQILHIFFDILMNTDYLYLYSSARQWIASYIIFKTRKC